MTHFGLMNESRASRQNHPTSEEVAKIREFFQGHTESELLKAFSWGALRRMIRGEPIRAIVMAADIRESTTLLSQEPTPSDFAAWLSPMMKAARTTVEASGGFFDKFTGDGFLAYWIPRDLAADMWESDSDREAEALLTALGLAVPLNQVFNKGLPMIRDAPTGRRTGFSIGIEVGDIGLFEIARQWTLLGLCVVKAVRIATSKKNVGATYIGEEAYRVLGSEHRHHVAFRLTRDELKTTDPSGPLTAYRVAPS